MPEGEHRDRLLDRISALDVIANGIKEALDVMMEEWLMTDEYQFWWNWWVSLAVAFFTLLAVLIALFGDWFRGKIFSPKIILNLRDKFGEKMPVSLQTTDEAGNINKTETIGRFYHVTLSNSKRWPAATQVQVFLISVEEPGPDGELKLSWSGEIPITWRNPNISPFTRTIGSPYDCDLCKVIKDVGLSLSLYIVPTNLNYLWKDASNIVIGLQAKSNEVQSEVTRFQISWDGEWEDGSLEMSHHIIIKPYPQTKFV